MFDFWLGIVAGAALGIAFWSAVTIILLENEIKKWKK